MEPAPRCDESNLHNPKPSQKQPLSSIKYKRMGLSSEHRWYKLAGAITLAFTALSLVMPRGFAIAAISNIAYLLLIVAVCIASLRNAWLCQGSPRKFWALMAAGGVLWAWHQCGYVYYEVVLRSPMPDPWVMDVVLFLHLVPIIAAISLRPHREASLRKVSAGTLDFLLLLVWWVFLYAFVVFPSQYVALNLTEYDRNYNSLYLIECVVVVLVLAIASRGASLGWKKIYVNVMAASALYALDSGIVNLSMTNGGYYSGSLYDVPLFASAGWIAATALSARREQMDAAPSTEEDIWGETALRLAMLAILSLPILGLWAYRWDHSPATARTFRLFTVLIAMLVLGTFLFIRQYLQDQALIHLLEASRQSYENEQRLQSHLVQREKLASLGQLIAGAAGEIEHPLSAVMDYSEKLWSGERLTPEQDKLVRKIVSQAQRTRDLVLNLLNFAQQGSSEKALVDLRTLIQRSVQMRQLQRAELKLRIETVIAPDLPSVWGDAHQLFQAFAQILENAQDALEETGGGLIEVTASRQGDEAVVQFSDSGAGIKEPHRVFDPFYTTKPIGKGTGLGLSAVYGVIQEHRGQITCQNKAEGGALFSIRLPAAAKEPANAGALAAAQG